MTDCKQNTNLIIDTKRARHAFCYYVVSGFARGPAIVHLFLTNRSASSSFEQMGDQASPQAQQELTQLEMQHEVILAKMETACAIEQQNLLQSHLESSRPTST